MPNMNTAVSTCTAGWLTRKNTNCSIVLPSQKTENPAMSCKIWKGDLDEMRRD